MRLLIIFLLLIPLTSFGQSSSSSLNLALPSMPGNYQYDKFRSGELDCQNAIGSATQLELGVTGIINNNQYDPATGEYTGNNKVGDVGVYARIVVPLGATAKERVNCNTLYQLELRKKQLEVLKLERELDQLRALQFENK